MNQVIEALEQRRSCRSYTDQPVDPKKLEQIVEAGLWAASGMGRQGTHLVVVTNPDDVAALSRMNAQIMGGTNDPFYGARAVIVVLTNPENPTCVEDGALVMGNLMNAAHEQGLGSCWIHRAKEEFDSPEGRQILADLGIEGDYEGIGHCILGYPEGLEPDPKPRKENYVYYVA